MQGSWQLVNITGKNETDKASGNKLIFEEDSQKLLFGSVQTVRHREQFGRLKLKINKTELFDAEVKLIRTDKHPKKRDAEGTTRFQVVPNSRLDVKAFGTLYGYVGITIDAEFWASTAGEGAGDGRPHADDEADDNVIPGSTAAHMKAAARKKAEDKATA